MKDNITEGRKTTKRRIRGVKERNKLQIFWILENMNEKFEYRLNKVI